MTDPTPTPLPRVSSASNPWFAVSMGLLGLIVGYGIASSMNAQSGQQLADAGTVPPVVEEEEPADIDDDAVLGDEDAQVTLIEFTDYQCPYCARHFSETYGKIKSEFIDTGKVKLVVRDYPLSFHPHAQKAAEASECAGEQDKFWEMHDKLFGTASQWTDLPDAVPTFKGFARELGLDSQEFESCLDSGEMSGEVARDQADGSESGIDGTPGFWVLGPDGTSKRISGAYPFETFKATFDGML